MLYRAEHDVGGATSDGIKWSILDHISPYILCAVTRAEDPTFFRHNGIAWRYIWYAVKDGVRYKRWRGGSTITQQLARNLYLQPERSVSRKLREAILARRLEQVLTKPRILELYLNVIEWGEGIWGIQAASLHYFGCIPAELGPLEAIVLTSFLPAPRRPLTGPNGARAKAAQFRLARQFLWEGLIRPIEAERLLQRLAMLWHEIPAAPSIAATLQQVHELPPILEPARLLSLEAALANECWCDCRPSRRS